MEKYFSKLVNNSVYGKAIKEKINAKNMGIIQMSYWIEKEAKRLFQELPFYNIFIENPKITHLKKINLLHELSFYDELNRMQISKAFEWYERTYKVEIIDSKETLAQLQASKSTIKNLFRYFFDEIKGFKYQITVKVLLRKNKENGDIEFAPVYFNSTTKTVINFKYDLEKYF